MRSVAVGYYNKRNHTLLLVFSFVVVVVCLRVCFFAGEESKAMAAQPACNAENMPAHFMQKSAERAARATSSSPASAASASPSPLAPAASASSVAASAQSRVLVSQPV